MSIDVVGYSTRSEQDEAAAVRAVAALSEQIAAVVQAHGGRVFNTAGDGFMLEFPTVTGALEAADALSASAVTPIRIGVHLGEVSVRKSGDLLGHGVNVAARLQALAPPGTVIVSDDVRRAVRGLYAKRLAPYGRIKLDKMKEAAPVFQLVAQGGKAKRRLPVGWMAAAAALAVAAAALAGGLWLVLPRLSAKPKDIRAAVQTFTAMGQNAPDAAFSEGVADRIASALQEGQVPTVSRNLVGRGDMSAVRLLVGGDVERNGTDLRVRVHIDDRVAGLILWSSSFQRPAQEADALQDEVATKVADVIGGVRQQLGSAAGQLSAEALAADMKARDLVRLGGDHREDARQAFRQFALLAPKFSRAHSGYALANIFSLDDEPPQLAAQRRKEATDEANTALALDPHNGEAYMALANLAPHTDIAQRETWLLKGLAADQNLGSLYNYEAGLMRAVGRNTEAFPLFNRALELDPLSAPKTVGMIVALASVGRYAEAGTLVDNAQRLWPKDRGLRDAAAMTWALYGAPEQALARMDAIQKGPRPVDERAHTAFVELIKARQGRLPKAEAVKALLATDDAAGLDAGTRLSALVILGNIDGAFGLLDRMTPEAAAYNQLELFMPANAPLRADPRFMPQMARLGLIRYWRTTGRWPDFCTGPAAPYDCRKAAAAAEAAAGPPSRSAP